MCCAAHTHTHTHMHLSLSVSVSLSLFRSCSSAAVWEVNLKCSRELNICYWLRHTVRPSVPPSPPLLLLPLLARRPRPHASLCSVPSRLCVRLLADQSPVGCRVHCLSLMLCERSAWPRCVSNIPSRYHSPDPAQLSPSPLCIVGKHAFK